MRAKEKEDLRRHVFAFNKEQTKKLGVKQ